MSTDNSFQVKALSDELSVAFGTSGVRGLVKDLTPELCFAFTASFLQGVCIDVQRVAVGIDLRPSSPTIAKAVIAAIEAQGATAIYCGALPTPALAFYAMQNSIPAVMVTGSHIPFDRNGIKFYRPDGEISKADEGAIMNGFVSLPVSMSEASLPSINTDAMRGFKDRYKVLFPNNMLLGKKIGVYEHSSAARDVIKRLLAHFGAEVVSLERTDTFVPIDTEAMSPQDIAKGLAWSHEHQLDAIISTDGDGDRPLIANEKGEWLRGDILGVLCADYLKASHVAAPVNVNTVLELQDPMRKTLRTKIGSPYVIAGMQILLEQAPVARIVGYEANGGFLVGSDFDVNGRTLHALPTRDSVLPALILLAMAHDKSCLISELINDYPARYTASDRIKDIPTEISLQFIDDVKNSEVIQTKLLSAIAAECEELIVVSVDETDGLRMTLNSGDIVHLRASGNAPEIRFYAESDTVLRAHVILGAVISKAL